MPPRGRERSSNAQVHAYAANTPERPWHNVRKTWPAHSTRRRDGGCDGKGRRRRRDLHLAVLEVPVRRYPRGLGATCPVQQVRSGQAGSTPDVIADWKKTPVTGGVRIILDESVEARAGRSGARPHPARRRQERFPGQRPVLGQRRRGHGADRPPPRRAVHHRPYGHPAAERTAGAAAALGPIFRKRWNSPSARMR